MSAVQCPCHSVSWPYSLYISKIEESADTVCGRYRQIEKTILYGKNTHIRCRGGEGGGVDLIDGTWLA